MVLPWPFPDDPWFRSPEVPEQQSEDLRLAALVAQRLSIDWTTRRQQIAVTVQNRVVILAGIVASSEARQVAGDLAWDVPGVFDVCNSLRLRPAERPGPRGR
ncbi:BON domain-containing protein [Micromonospora sp. LZ34]